MLDKKLAAQETIDRAKSRKLFIKYAKLYDHYRPYGPDNVGVYHWQAEFHNAGAEYQQRCLIAANRVGKSVAGAVEIAIHMTGKYPPWWKGRRFDHPVTVWCGSVTNEASRDIVQSALLGGQEDTGTGWIPKERIIKVSRRQAGIAEVVETILVRHSSGGVSEATLKTYEQGRKVWQGRSVDVIWLDEEPPMPIYTEALTRILDKKGLLYLTFTPLEGPTEVVRHFMDAKEGMGLYMKNASWEDAPHLPDKEKDQLKMSYPVHERETRTKGTPLLGSGAIFPVSDDLLLTEPVEIKPWWRRINGIDFGIDHPAAGVFCALDPEGEGTFYVYDCYKAPGETAVYHAAAMKKHGDWIPTSWPHDGIERDKGSGIALKDQYRSHGLYMLKEHAHYADERGNHVEPGLIEMLEWMKTGRFKVFSSCPKWFEEKRLYHRKDGLVVKKVDDLMAATRYAFIMRRYARTAPSQNTGSQLPSKPIIGPRRWRG